MQAEIELVFAHLSNGMDLFEPESFCRMMCMLRAFEVGHAADGSRLKPPSAYCCMPWTWVTRPSKLALR